MLMGDFLTFVQQDLPVKVVVFNNSSLGFIEIEQKSSGFLDTWTTLKNPNFAAVAESIGVRGIRLAGATLRECDIFRFRRIHFVNADGSIRHPNVGWLPK